MAFTCLNTKGYEKVLEKEWRCIDRKTFFLTAYICIHNEQITKSRNNAERKITFFFFFFTKQRTVFFAIGGVKWRAVPPVIFIDEQVPPTGLSLTNAYICMRTVECIECTESRGRTWTQLYRASRVRQKWKQHLACSDLIETKLELHSPAPSPFPSPSLLRSLSPFLFQFKLLPPRKLFRHLPLIDGWERGSFLHPSKLTFKWEL